MYTLYSYWRSTTSYRVRVALNLKGVAYRTEPVDLVAGEQRAEAYARLNPGQGVPTLVLEDGTPLRQSMAILEWLQEVHPSPSILPDDPVARGEGPGSRDGDCHGHSSRQQSARGRQAEGHGAQPGRSDRLDEPLDGAWV